MFYFYRKVDAMAVVGFGNWHAEHAAEGRVGGVGGGGLLDVVGCEDWAGGVGGVVGRREGGREGGALRLGLRKKSVGLIGVHWILGCVWVESRFSWIKCEKDRAIMNIVC